MSLLLNVSLNSRPEGTKQELRNMFDVISMGLYTSQYPISRMFRSYNRQENGEFKGVKI